MNFKHYIKASRLRTLPLSVSGIIVGSSLGNYEYWFNKSFFCCFGCPSVLQSPIFWLAILTTIGFQVLSNFANDYGDGVKGTDENRVGEQRLVASGVISPRQMKRAMWVTGVLTLIVALLLIYTAFGSKNFGYSILFFVLGLASIASAVKYTVGKNAYGYSGLGDVFVFLFFGLLAVVGSYFLFTKQINWQVFLPAFSIGLLSTAVLNLNNLRDVENDAKSGKNTLVVKMGSRNGKVYHTVLIVTALFCALAYSFLNYFRPQQFIYVIAFVPLFFNIKTVWKNKEPKALDSELKKVALSTFLFALLFSIFH